MTKWVVANCQSAGPMHEVCQDYTAFIQDNKVTVAALADGVSSSVLADQGAKIAAEAACEEIADHFKAYESGKYTEKDFVQLIQHEVRQHCDSEKQYSQMKCTLLFCAVCGNRYLLGHIGDGAILYFGDDTRVISPPQENEVGGTATYTILDYNAGEHMVFKRGKVDGCDGFLLTSDGLLGNVYSSAGTEVPQLAYDLFHSVAELSREYAKEDMDERLRDYLFNYIQKDNKLADDCSLAVISRIPYTGLVDYEIKNGFEPDVKWPCLCGNWNHMDEIRCSDCRKMYIDIYDDRIIDIISKEGFFSRLHAWIGTSGERPFDPQGSAQILEPAAFAARCKALKAVHNPEAGDVRGSRQQTSSASVFPDYPKYSNDPKYLNDPKYSKRSLPERRESKTKFLDQGLKAGKKLFHGFRQVADAMGDRHKNQGNESTKMKKRKDRGITLEYDEMLEAGYQLGYLPVEFLPIGGSLPVSKEKKYMVEAMYRSTWYLDWCEASREQISAQRLYVTAKNLILVEDRDEEALNGLIISRENPDLDKVLNRLNFPKKTARSGNPEMPEGPLPRLILDWNWGISVEQARRDADFLYESFCKELKTIGPNPYLQRIEADANIRTIWMIGNQNGAKRLCAWIITDGSWYQLYSIHDSQVVLERTDREQALEIRARFLEEYLG